VIRRPVLSVGRRVRQHHVLKVLDMLPVPRTALDAGCGDAALAAALAQRLPSAEVLGVDIDISSLARAAAVANSVENLTVREAEVGGRSLGRTFDLVVCVDVLEHIDDDDTALDWLAEHMGPAGALVMHVPATSQQHRISSVGRRMCNEIASGTSQHVREGYEGKELSGRLVQRDLNVVAAAHTFHGAIVQFAEDVDTWLYHRHLRTLKALLLPWLLLAATLERTPSAQRRGYGLLLVALR
jgi:trans-aconitate methyltransferase